MSDEKVMIEEARRAAQHRKVKARIQDEVNAEIESDAAAARDERQLHQAARALRGSAVEGVVSTEREVVRGRQAARAGQFVDYLFGAVYVLLGIRLVLALIAARPGAAFSQWIQAITTPLLAPFKGILPNLTTPEGYTLALPVLFAIVIYGVLHLAVKGMLRLIGERRTEV